MSKQPKYFAKRFEKDGAVWDSKWEYSRWLYLKELQSLGIIHGLQRQAEYELIPKQTISVEQFGKRGQPIKPKIRVLEQPVTYKADFTYTKSSSGEFVVEDTKSEFTRTKDYIIKRKLMLYIHGIRIVEVSQPKKKKKQ